MQIAMVKRAFGDSPHCGDQCGHWQSGGKTILCVVDGLGHGVYAERAAKAALEYVAQHLSQPLREMLAGCDQALRGTRGVAMGIAVVDPAAGTLTYAGIGNTRAMVAGARVVRLSSNWGIVGGGYRTLSPETVPLKAGDLVILSTDGVAERMELSGYGHALRAGVRQLAEQIIQDWRCETDDAAVLVFRADSL